MFTLTLKHKSISRFSRQAIHASSTNKVSLKVNVPVLPLFKLDANTPDTEMRGAHLVSEVEMNCGSPVWRPSRSPCSDSTEAGLSSSRSSSASS